MRRKLKQLALAAALGAAIGIAGFLGVEIYKATEEPGIDEVES